MNPKERFPKYLKDPAATTMVAKAKAKMAAAKLE